MSVSECVCECVRVYVTFECVRLCVCERVCVLVYVVFECVRLRVRESVCEFVRVSVCVCVNKESRQRSRRDGLRGKSCPLLSFLFNTSS